MKRLKRKLSLAVILCAIPVAVWAVWPATDVNTTNMDSDFDSGTAARLDILDLTTKFNQLRTHVSTFAQGLLDDIDAAAMRTTLDVPGLSVANTFGNINSTVATGSSGHTYDSLTSGDVRILLKLDGVEKYDLFLTRATGDFEIRKIGSSTAFKINSDSTIEVVGNTTVTGTLAISKNITTGTLQTLIKPAASSAFTSVYGALQVLSTANVTSDATGTQYQGSGTHNFWGIKKSTNNQVLAVNLTGTPVDAISVDTAGAITIADDLSSTKACAAGYTRISPNWCHRTGIGTTALTRDVCTTITIPTGAKVLWFSGTATAKKAGSASLRNATVQAYSVSGCGSGLIANLANSQATENPAGTSGNLMVKAQYTYPIDVSGGSLFLRFSDDAGNTGSADYEIVSYID